MVAVVIAGCSGAAVPKQTKEIRSTKIVSLKRDCAAATCDGSRGGAKYEVKLPPKSKWNGTLLIWSHGYRNAVAIPANPLDPTAGTESVDTSASAGPADEVTSALVSQGYAMIGSAFKTNGWDVKEAVAADEDLYSYFSSTFGTPKRVYIWGASLGGLITETLAEKHHDWVSGVAPLCGVLGGTNLNLDLALDVAYAVKTLVYPALKLSGFTSADEAISNWTAAAHAVVDKAQNGGAEGIADLLTIASIAGAPGKTKTYDGHDILSTGQAYAEAVITALGYGTWGRYDIEQRVSGDPSTNQNVDYATRLDDAQRAEIEAVAPGKLASIMARLATGQRVQADSAARSKADALGDPTGDLDAPTITMHTIDDPLVLSQNETVFAGRVSKHPGDSGQLVQMFTVPPTQYTSAPYGAGHCNFTKDEMVGVITLLNNWVQKGVYAGPGAVEAALNVSPDDAQSARNTPAKQAAGTATTGYSFTVSAGPWPASTSQ
jgi:pimeloyl-ACP methyl ester carboxylesterase